MPDRTRRKWIADTTLDVCGNREIYDKANRWRHDLRPSIQTMLANTNIYPHNSRSLTPWRISRKNVMQQTPVHIERHKKTTLEGARYLEGAAAPQGQSAGPARIGILNFASATKPGGGWRNGASAQEESLARSSTLAMSLESHPAQTGFYDLHRRDGGSNSGFYTHAMVWTPNVTIFRDDDGGWVRPFEVAVVTSAAVNAKEVRGRSSNGVNKGLEEAIEEAMKERMGRILALFEQRCCTDLVLGAFGTGVFQNDVEMVGRVWGELLQAPRARFKRSFRSVIFAIPDGRTGDTLMEGFWGTTARPRPVLRGNGSGP